VTASPRCDGCGVELLPDSSFCHACGVAQGVSARPAAAHGERKRITVLFVDALGSMGRAGRVDAEQWHDIVDRFFSLVSVGVRLYGGTIDRLTEGGVKVLFGAPAALESHAAQACHAALHVAQRLEELATSVRARSGIELAVRMGLNSGEVVFGSIGTGEAGSLPFTSQGHPAALAARMQQIAEPGRIYVTEHTAALVADYFDLRELGPQAVRNAGRALRVFLLLGARAQRTRLDAARERGLSPFIGREHELRALAQELEGTRGGLCRVVGIVGEPGIGKSRLAEEFVARQRARGVQTHATRSFEHARWIPFHASLAYLRDVLMIAATADARATRARLEHALRGLDPALLTGALPVLLSLLGAADSGPGLPTDAGGSVAPRLASVIRTVIERGATGSPAIFVLDDQQWMDAGSDSVIDDLVHDPPRASVLVLVTYRRGHGRRWMNHPSFTELSLRPLDQPATLRLARTLLGEDRSVATLAERIAERAAGNPFFVEESVLALVDSDALEGSRGSYRLRTARVEAIVPGTLHAVLAARIDQLAEREKEVLQAAAVIGREFPAALLGAVSGCDEAELAAILRALEEADFLSAIGWGGDATYHFRHPLLRETVYHSLLREHQAATHRLVVRQMQRLYGERTDELAAQLALHAEAAGDTLDAARWHRRAARATMRWEPTQELEHWHRVLACTGRCDPQDAEASRLRLLACEAIVRLGFHQGLGPVEAEDLVREGGRIARRLGDLRVQALLSSAAGSLRSAAGDLEAGTAHHADALAYARRTGDPELALLSGARLVMAKSLAGRLLEAQAIADELLARHRSTPIASPTPGLVSAHQLELARAVVLIDRGRIEEGAAELQRVIRELRGENAPIVLGWALSLTASVVRHSGDEAPALLANVEEGLALARRLGVRTLLVRALCAVATVRLCQDRWEDALALAEEADETMRSVGHAVYVDFDPTLLLSYARFGLGDVAGARAAARKAMHDAFASGSRLGQIDTMIAHGRILARYGSPTDVVEAKHLLRHGLALVRRCGAHSRQPFYWFELAGLDRREGREDRARARQRRAGRMLVALGAVGHLRRAAGLMTTPPERLANPPRSS